jgi:hypothetical protein
MTQFAVSLLSRFALGSTIACAAAMATSPPADAPERRSPTGFEEAAGYFHLGHERYFHEEEPLDGPEFGWGMTWQARAQARLYRVQAGLALGLDFRWEGRKSGSDKSNGASYGAGYGIREAWLRFPFRCGNGGIQAGRMILQDNPDAVLFGNYLALHDPLRDLRPITARLIDSLGVVTARELGARLAIGAQDALLRGEVWIVREPAERIVSEDDDFSVLGFLSGSAPYGLAWGLGLGGYRVLPRRSAILSTLSERNDGKLDTAEYTLREFLVSLRLSLDWVGMMGADAPAGRYGALFAEAAVLGVEGKPYSDPRMGRRLAWTTGARLPVSGWLDACVIQAEWQPMRRRAGAYWAYSTDTSQRLPGRSRSYFSAFGILITKRLTPIAEVEARLQSMDVNIYPWSYVAMDSRVRFMRRTDLLARLVYRIP